MLLSYTYNSIVERSWLVTKTVMVYLDIRSIVNQSITEMKFLD